MLISQNRNSKVDDWREETNLQINIIAEKEITKVMKMLVILLERNGVDISQDPELKNYLNQLVKKKLKRN